MAYQTFRSLYILVAEKRTDMGKNADESAGGTTNSSDPLPISQQETNTYNQPKVYQNDLMQHVLQCLKICTDLRLELSMRSMDHSKVEFLESYLQDKQDSTNIIVHI